MWCKRNSKNGRYSKNAIPAKRIRESIRGLFAFGIRETFGDCFCIRHSRVAIMKRKRIHSSQKTQFVLLLLEAFGYRDRSLSSVSMSRPSIDSQLCGTVRQSRPKIFELEPSIKMLVCHHGGGFGTSRSKSIKRLSCCFAHIAKSVT